MFTPTNAASVSRRLRSASTGLSSRRARQRGHRAHRVATTQHLPRGGLEHLRDPLIRLDARLGQMPRLPLRLVCPHAGQGAMCFATLLCRRQLDDRGAGQGVAKDQPASLRIDVHQPASLGGRQVPQLGVSGCPLQRRQVACAVQRGEQEQAPCRGWQLLDTRCEQLAQPGAERQQRGRPRGGERPAPAQRRRQLEQCERIAGRFGEQTPAHVRTEDREPRSHKAVRRVASPAARAGTEAAGALEDAPGRGAQCGQQADVAAGQPPSHEPQHLRARAIHPEHVVQHDQQRLLLARAPYELERRARDDQPVRGPALAEPQRDREGVAVQRAQLLDPVQQRQQRLVERREADIGLEFRTGCAYHADAERDGAPRGDVQQRGLADAGVSDQHQRLAAEPPRVR